MKVLAIDPGYDRLGIAILERIENTETVLYSSCFETSKVKDFTERLFLIGQEIENILEKQKPDTVAIETLFFNKNVKTAIGVAQARGVILYLAKKYGCRVYEYGPQEIKVAVTGYGKSDKNAVFSMLKKLLKNLPENALDDEYDAIAVGITCLAHNRNYK